MEDRPSTPPTQIPEGRSRTRSIPWLVAAGLLGVILAAGGGTAWWTWNTLTTDRVPTEAPAPSERPSPAVPTEQTAQVFWLKDTGTNLELVPSSIALDSSQPAADQLKAAFTELLNKPPQQADLSSTIPPETQLLNLEVKDDGVHVNLSQEFTQGGGSASMQGRLAQVIYTASSLDANAPVWISVQGEALEVLGGEGILVNQPMTRSQFEQEFSL